MCQTLIDAFLERCCAVYRPVVDEAGVQNSMFLFRVFNTIHSGFSFSLPSNPSSTFYPFLCLFLFLLLLTMSFNSSVVKDIDKMPAACSDEIVVLVVYEDKLKALQDFSSS